MAIIGSKIFLNQAPQLKIATMEAYLRTQDPSHLRAN